MQHLHEKICIFLNLTLCLFMLGIGANHHDFASSFDNAAFFTNRFNRSSDFHIETPFDQKLTRNYL